MNKIICLQHNVVFHYKKTSILFLWTRENIYHNLYYSFILILFYKSKGGTENNSKSTWGDSLYFSFVLSNKIIEEMQHKVP